MNDDELDRLLDAWHVPGPPASLRPKVRASFRARFRRSWWIASFMPRAATIAAAAMFALVLLKAAPAVLWAPEAAANAAVTMQTENWEYAPDGSATLTVSNVGYDNDGGEIPMSRTFPNEPLKTMGQRAVDWIVSLHNELAVTIHGGGRGQHTVDPTAGCTAGTAVGDETILGHRTIKLQDMRGNERRATIWAAPDMKCFALKYVVEARQADGSYRMLFRNQAVSIR